MPATLSICSDQVLTDLGLAPATIHIEDGRIATVSYGESRSAMDLSGLVILPGMVDTHVHVNEPGRTDWEGFETATRAAAAGGVTTIVVMPLNSTPAATNRAALREEEFAAQDKCVVDHGFWGGIIPGNAERLAGMWEAGALGFKCFLSPSGVDDFPNVGAADLEQACDALSHIRPRPPLLAHAEDPAFLSPAPSSRRYADYLASRPPQAEVSAIRLLIDLCRKHRQPIHIVHLATEAAVPDIANAKHDQLPLTVETCPHYLTFAAEEIPDGATLFKCAPPIRAGTTAESLWLALRERQIDLIASDHSPCPPEMKHLDSGDFSKAWGGISSLQLSVSAAWTGAHARGFSLANLSRWMSTSPAQLAGLSRKGRIAPGFDADLIAFNPDALWTVDQSKLYHRHKPTPYHGMRLRGVVEQTFLRGVKVFDRSLADPFPAGKTGQWLKRP